jgi:hypothetical protein
LSRKPTTNKSDKKKLFFGEHLEIKPAFMQRPKSMEEVMAEAFSQNNLNKDELNTTVELQATVENPANLVIDKEIKTTVDSNTTLAVNASVENLLNSSNSNKEIETAVASNATLAPTTTVENIASLKDSKNSVALSDETSLSELLPATVANNATVVNKSNNIETLATVVNSATVVNKSNNIKTLATIANSATVVKKSNNIETSAAVANSATVVKKAIELENIPQRLRADISLLNRLVVVHWQSLPEQENISSNYWYAYAQAWHWIEDNVLPHLDKDSKLTLRYCYRKAFGDPMAKGRFFAGQTLLAQEVGLSKRRIQDVLEIFNLLGWVCKTAHHNRGGYKGTEYQMCLPIEVINYFI